MRWRPNGVRAMRRCRVGRTGWLAFLAAAFLLGAVPGRAQTPAASTPPVIRRITFSGVHQVSSGDLRHVMRLRQRPWWQFLRKSYFYGPDYLERDLDRILTHYRGEGFVFARIEEALVRYLTRDRVDLEIRVREGARIYVRNIAVLGASGVLQRRLAKGVTIQRGEPLREFAVAAEEERLRQTCAEGGFALAEVIQELRFHADSVAVLYWVDPGPLVRVGQIRVAGVVRTREGVVRREMRLRTGDVFRRSQALAAQERLFDLGLFRTVRILPAYCDTCPVPQSGELSVDLTLSVAEKPPGWYGFGLGFSSADEVRLVGEWGYRNWMGRARGVQVNGLIAFPVGQRSAEIAGAQDRQLEVTYTEPWVFRTPLRGQMRSYYRFHREPTFDEKTLGFVLRMSRDIGRYEQLVGSVENKWVDTGDSTVAQARYQTRFVSLSIGKDTRDFALDPRRGQYNQLSIEHAGGFLGGSASFMRWVAGAATYIPARPWLTVALRSRAGYIHPIGKGVAAEGEERLLLRVPFDERFRAGGGTTVRGYAERSLGVYSADGQPLGGLALLVLNGELRFPLVWQLGAAVFMDAGNVWEDYKEINWSRWSRGLRETTYSPLDVAYGGGIGLRMKTPVGPLRLDYGVKFGRALRAAARRGEWHFSLGQAF